MSLEQGTARSGGGAAGSPPSMVEDLYKSWFLDYASYVILDRAVPHINDGLKPVQRRLLHALWELDDGRLNKAANIIGHTMRYHPHGDMAIEDALVKLAQKELLIDMQGNWGNTLTGDRAAAPRYIEARLSALAKDILFHEDLTSWQASYDGRNKEPQHLPVKFPLLLALGVEGIAVGLATKILPHNFGELCDAAILHLQAKNFELFPDFPSGGIADFSAYQNGQRGGKARVRAKIHIVDAKTLQIQELPFGASTVSLIESILSAHEKGKIKIKKVEDNTGHHVDISIQLPPGVSAEQTVEALYAFTDCELSISVNCCVIQDEKPAFLGASDLLKFATEKTRDLLRRELELSLQSIRSKILKATLEQIFIEQKIYRKLEEAGDWAAALLLLQKAFKPFLKNIELAVKDSDLEALLEIRFKRLTKYDSEGAQVHLAKLRADLLVTEGYLQGLTAYAIDWFKSLKKRYGQGLKRKTKRAAFGDVKLRELVLANQKFYLNRQEGFLGTSLKKDEFLTDCSDLDEVIAVRRNGQAMLIKVCDKAFVGEDIIFAAVIPPSGAVTLLHVMYRDQNGAAVLAKSLKLSGWTRDKSYELAKGITEVLFAQLWPEGADAWVDLELCHESQPLRFNFGSLSLDTRASLGRVVTLRQVASLSQGVSANRPVLVKLSYDAKAKKIGEMKGNQTLGTFGIESRLLALSADGELRIFTAAFPQQLKAPLIACHKWSQESVVSLIYRAKGSDSLLMRRIKTDDWGDGSSHQVPDAQGATWLWVGLEAQPCLKLSYQSQAEFTPPSEILLLAELVGLRSLAAPPVKLQRLGVALIESLGCNSPGLNGS